MRWQSFLVGILVLAAVVGAKAEELPPQVDIEVFDPNEIEAAAIDQSSGELYFFGDVHEVQLETVNVRSDRFRLTSNGDTEVVDASPTRTFRGHIVGDPDSRVRLSLFDNHIRGYVKNDTGWTFIRPLPPEAAIRPREHAVFTEADLPPDSVGQCSTGMNQVVGSSTARSVRSVVMPQTAGSHETQGIFELAIDADFDYVSMHSDPVGEIESLINEVDGIFHDELGLRIQIVHLNTWQSPSDPYTSFDPATLLDEFKNYWNNNQGSISRDAAHLFTGKDLSGTAVGIAFVGVVCFTPAAYALSQQMSTNSLMPLLVAHEIGHTFGSDHDTTGTSPRYIMYPNLGVSNLEQFSPSSREQITSYIATEACITQSLQPPTNPPNSPPEEVSDTSWTITGDSQIKIGKMRVPGSWSGSLDFNADGTFVYSIPSLSNPLTTVQFTGMWTQQKKKVLLFPSGQSFFDYASEVQAYVQATTGLTETSSLLDWQIKVKVNTKAGTLKLKMKQKGFVTFDKYKAKMKGLAFPN